MELIYELLEKSYKIKLNLFEDQRGDFLKIFNTDLFLKNGLNFKVNEIYVSTSSVQVLRGMHFQVGEYAHDKLVVCMEGSAKDVLLDLRKKNYGKIGETQLNKGEAVFIPKGVAHGFLSTNISTKLLYCTSTVYSPTHDKGIRWNSFGFNWEEENPILSERDKNQELFKNNKFIF
jgi:dTDP-4-dehydrorhamnose 3,5-epimerase